MNETEEMHRRTGGCYKHNISAENSTTRDSVDIKEGFRFQIMLVETGLEGGGGDLIKKVANREGKISFEKLNR